MAAENTIDRSEIRNVSGSDEIRFVKKRLPFRQIGPYSIIHRGAARVCLDESGTQLWSLIDGSRSAKEIALETIDGSEETWSEVQPVVNRFLEQLHRLGLIELKDSTASPLPAAVGVSEMGSSRPSAPPGLLRPVQDECSTPKSSNFEPKTLSQRIDQFYWSNFFIQKMHLEVTYRCNFRCVHCYNTTHAGAENELSFAQWERVLDQLAGLGCYLLTFTGGELFVRKDTVSLLEAAASRGFTFRVNTNASLIDDRMIERLEPLRPFIQSFDISVYGATAEVHDALARRPGSHGATMRGITALKAANFPLVAKFVTLRDNFTGVDRFEEDMRGLGITSVIHTGSVIPQTNRNTAPLVQILTDSQYEHFLQTRSVIGSSDPGHCKPGHVRGAVTPDGHVSPCEWLTDFKLGDLRQQPLREIWYGSEFAAFRKVFEQESECDPCGLRPGCNRCPAHSYLETGNLLHCAPVQQRQAQMLFDYQARQAVAV
ncbi:MAG: PqqD family peptide modification chaperone [Acidobacteriaceae bacterium]|nr:PqqD family peptide modification chaperone [Acidobacteriaceae bacterium]